MGTNETFADVVRCRVAAINDASVISIGQLYDLTADRLVRLAISITGHQQDGEDAVQTVLTRVAANPTALVQADHPWRYLLTMVRHEAIAVSKRTHRFAMLRSLADLVTRLPVDHLERRETYAEVWRSLRRLPAEQAEVVVLKIWEGLTLAEIATLTDQSIDTVASRHRYAMDKLRRMLTPRLGDASAASRHDWCSVTQNGRWRRVGPRR